MNWRSEAEHSTVTCSLLAEHSRVTQVHLAVPFRSSGFWHRNCAQLAGGSHRLKVAVKVNQNKTYARETRKHAVAIGAASADGVRVRSIRLGEFQSNDCSHAILRRSLHASVVSQRLTSATATKGLRSYRERTVAYANRQNHRSNQFR